MADETKSIERWTYIGRRVLVGGQLGTGFIDGEGRELAYSSKARQSVIGGLYEVPVTRSDDGDATSITPAEIQFVEAPDPNDERVPAWGLADRTAYTADELRKREQKAKRDGGGRLGELTFEEFRTQYWKAPAPQQAAMLAQMLRYVGVA